VPRNEEFPLDRFETGLITWWSDEKERKGSVTAAARSVEVSAG
jgi:hypothetical protein